MRTACYARFSSDLQRQTSLDDQLRNCQEYAARFGWTWQEELVFTDAGISGASIDGRPGLQALLNAATQQPRPFDVLLVDDSSRVSRDLADALRIVQRLKFAGVRVIYISQGIDSDAEQHETLIAVHGLVDGLYLREMAAKIKRGLRGQLQRGFATGSKTYGYRSVAVPDAQRHGEVQGYRVEVEPIEADAIRAIFDWYGAGASIPSIVTRAVQQGHPAPRGGQWRRGAIQRILQNPKYTGRLVWGRTQRVRRPGARTASMRAVPSDQWQTLPSPELRIVSDAQWARAQARRRETDALLERRRQPASNLLRGRDARVSATTLFSGFIECGICGHRVSVVTNRLYHGRRYRYYGCVHAKMNGPTACTNHQYARVEAADRALLAGLQAELQRPETLDYIAGQLRAALQAMTDQRPAQRESLARGIAAARRKLHHLIAAVENGAGTTTVLAAIADREVEIRALEAKQTDLSAPAGRRLAAHTTWVKQQLRDAAAIVAEVPERARLEFQRLGIRFALHPVREDGEKPFLRAVGIGDFEALAFGSAPVFTISDRSHRQSAGSRTFIVDLPASKGQVKSA